MNVWNSGRESKLLDDIMAGRKTIEGRLKRGKFAQYKVGDEIRLRRDMRDKNGVLHDGKPDVARVRIVALREYSDFLAMCTAEDFTKIIPYAKNAKEASAVYDKYYSKAEQNRFGVLAIEVKLWIQ